MFYYHADEVLCTPDHPEGTSISLLEKELKALKIDYSLKLFELIQDLCDLEDELAEFKNVTVPENHRKS